MDYITRYEKFLHAAAEGVPLADNPVTREEVYLSKIAGADVTVPEPVTRIEFYLSKIAGEDVEVPDPVTRVETYLAAIAGEDVPIHEPITREEIILNEWAGGEPIGVLKTVSGSVVSVLDALKKPVDSLVVGIEPVQEGTGDPSPDNVRPITGFTEAKVTRTGKNLLDIGTPTDWMYGTGGRMLISGTEITIRVEGSGMTKYMRDYPFPGNKRFALSAKATKYNARLFIMLRKKDDSDWMTSADASIPGCVYNSFYQGWYKDSGGTYSVAASVDIPDCAYWNLGIGFNNSHATTGDDETWSDLQVEIGSTPTDYEPYSGYTTYDVTFPSEAGTVYGGSLDVTTGVLTVDRANISSYAGETLPGEWISDRDVYAPGTSPTTGAQVVYKLSSPITYQLTPTEVMMLLGVNNVWADTGDITMKYYASGD